MTMIDGMDIEGYSRPMWLKIRVFILLIFITGCSQINSAEPVRLVIDSHTRYQTIEGWGATLPILGIPMEGEGGWFQDPTPENYDRLGIKDPVPDELKARIMDAAVYDLGLNRFRLEVGPQVELVNDNDDPMKIEIRAFRFKWQDFLIKKWLLPLKRRVEKRGERLVLYVSYSMGNRLTPDWLLNPEEYAEMAVATLRYLKEKYGIEPDYWTIMNEPGNRRPGNPDLIARLIAATGRKIVEEGLKTKVSGPEVVTPRQITPYMKAINRNKEALKYLGEITYHLYWDPFNIVKRIEIRRWSERLNVPSAQTEWLEGKGLEVVKALYLDLTVANASSWEQYGLCYVINNYNRKGGGDYFVINRDFSGFYMNTNSWYLRQFFRYVRPGDVRIKITTPDKSIMPVAFLKPNGSMVVVVINKGLWKKEIMIKSLRSDVYGVVMTNSRVKGRELPEVSVDGDKYLRFIIPPEGVVTFYPVKGS